MCTWYEVYPPLLEIDLGDMDLHPVADVPAAAAVGGKRLVGLVELHELA